MRLQNLPKAIELVHDQLISAICLVNYHSQPPYWTLIGNQSYQNRPLLRTQANLDKAFRVALISKTEKVKNKKQTFKPLINKQKNHSVHLVHPLVEKGLVYSSHVHHWDLTMTTERSRDVKGTPPFFLCRCVHKALELQFGT